MTVVGFQDGPAYTHLSNSCGTFNTSSSKCEEAIEYIAGTVVWFVFERLLLDDFTWEWHVRLAVLGSLVILPGIVLFLVAQQLG